MGREASAREPLFTYFAVFHIRDACANFAIGRGVGADHAYRLCVAAAYRFDSYKMVHAFAGNYDLPEVISRFGIISSPVSATFTTYGSINLNTYLYFITFAFNQTKLWLSYPLSGDKETRERSEIL